MSLIVEHYGDLGITRLSRWIFNCYLIHGDRSCVVVDPGLPGIRDDVAGVLAVLGGTVTAVVATHGHSDHVAGAPGLVTETLRHCISRRSLSVTWTGHCNRAPPRCRRWRGSGRPC